MSKLEMWLPIEGYEEFYEVSDLGRVKQLETWRYDNRTKEDKYYEEKVLRQYAVKSHGGKYGEYMTVTLTNEEGKRAKLYVHSLVAKAFCEKPRGYKTEVNHIDRDKKNNDSRNLEWITHKENAHHWMLES